jgi:hypothetical protein
MRTAQIVVIVVNLACAALNFFSILRLRKKTKELIAARTEMENLISHAIQIMKESDAKKA